MTHARTVPRYACSLGLVACFLAPVSSLAAINPEGLYVMSSQSTGVKTGQYIEAAATARYQPFLGGGTRLYSKQMVPVATSTLRKGALSALGRGVMHPGFQVALLAAGVVWNAYDGFHEEGTGGTEEYLTGTYDSLNDIPHVSSPPCSIGIYRKFNSIAYTTFGPNSDPSITGYMDSNYCPSRPSGTRRVYLWHFMNADEFQGGDIVIDRDVPVVSVSDDDLSSRVDPHIPPQLYDELYNDGLIPVWQDEITVLGEPASLVQPTGDQSVAPEVATQIGKWGENVQAQLDGQPLPHPDADADGITSGDKLAEDLDLDGPVPPFPGAEPEWQVETIDSLPAFDMGLGSGVCPAPTVVNVPLYGVVELSWQPACDFAGWIRGAVIAVCMILALYIVLGTRATTA